MRLVREIPFRGQFSHAAQGRRSEQSRLVESALALTGGEERDGNDDEIFRCLLAQLEDCVGEPAAEDIFSQRAAPFKLEQVEEFAQLGIVGGKGYGAGEVRRSKAAEGAFSNAEGGSKARGFQIESIAAAGAEAFSLRSHTVKTRMADLAGAKIEHRSAAEAAVGGKEEVDEIGRGRSRATSEDARYSTPTRRPTTRRGCWNQVPELYVPQAAAEDGPHPWHKQKKLQLCRWVECSSAAGIGQLEDEPQARPSVNVLKHLQV